MSNLATFKYSLKISFIQLSPFYGTLIAIECMYILLKMMYGNNFMGTSTMGSWDVMALFVATAIPCGFHERFKFFIQNGYSRKTLFINFLVCFVTCALAMAVFESLIVIASDTIGLNYKPLFGSIYESRYALTSANMIVEGTIWHFFSFLAMMGIAFPMAIGFYRMTKFYRVLVFMVLPSILLLGFPILDFALFHGETTQQVFLFLLKILGLYESANPMIALLPFTIISVVGCILSYILIKHVNIQK